MDTRGRCTFRERCTHSRIWKWRANIFRSCTKHTASNSINPSKVEYHQLKLPPCAYNFGYSNAKATNTQNQPSRKNSFHGPFPSNSFCLLIYLNKLTFYSSIDICISVLNNRRLCQSQVLQDPYSDPIWPPQEATKAGHCNAGCFRQDLSERRRQIDLLDRIQCHTTVTSFS